MDKLEKAKEQEKIRKEAEEKIRVEMEQRIDE